MATPVIVSRVRTALHKQGYQGFTKEQILDAAKALNIDIDNPTSEDTKAVVAHIITTATPSESAITTGVNHEQLEALQSTIQPTIEQPTIDQPSTPEPNNTSSITHTQKVDMVNNQAKILGIELSTVEAEKIATQINLQQTDSNDMMGEIKSLLIAYIDYHETQNQAKVAQTFSEIINHANASNYRVSSTISDNFQVLTTQLEESRNHFKSSVRGALKCFVLPETKA